uniref:hypothetical protein n=1 Tax=Rugamonas sp. TaxID=1926287 RepID=UPI0025F60FFB
MKLKQTPQQWKAENQAIKEVIRKEVSKIPIEDKLGTDCDELLLEWVWHACACAKTYDKKTDVYRLKRMKDTEELSQGRRAITNAAKALLKGLKMNPKLASGSSVRAFFSLRDQGITFLARKDGTAMPPEELLSTALTELIEGVKHPALSLRNGNFLHETCHGCLGYPDPIRSSRLPDADFMLLFAVVLYIRLRSLGGR